MPVWPGFWSVVPLFAHLCLSGVALHLRSLWNPIRVPIGRSSSQLVRWCPNHAARCSPWTTFSAYNLVFPFQAALIWFVSLTNRGSFFQFYLIETFSQVNPVLIIAFASPA